ncbi:energy-coupling factor transporter ATPase [Macrococcus hajekii]|uniref:Energy-coupling factor transporter ATPase n=1 Tax=Macrococcus hajekii TaxID=198482 RepID=A0A4R6BJP4_9STAP|nr:energy-coupling factor transporter ATPase [Macrococcus hajekii]TDM01816.1 energy-coupling factor transporter ATPase [Macrococcus hajekii]GGB07683.1 energy-coupling factor transporter ATP-binding protein EcfA1 [Macrococcus hajekii]
MLEVSHISYQYEKQETAALTDVSFSINRGEWVSIVGHNGSGKSTLVKLLGAILPLQEGRITVESLAVSEVNSYDIHGKVGMVFQNPDNQFVGATVEDDIAFGLENYGIDYEEMHRRVDTVLDAVSMHHMKTHEPHHLSGGQKQRVAIAGVIALRPDIIILDEATAMLDPEGRREVLSVIRQLQHDLNLTVIAITHDLEETVEADRLLVMHQGRLLMQGTPQDLFERGDELQALGLPLPFSMRMYQLITGESKFVKDEELLTYL